MSIAIGKFKGDEGRKYDFLENALVDIAEICREEKTVVIFDEFPYLVSTNPAAASVMQGFIDNHLDGTDTMLILCGSSKSAMERETSEEDRPLYGRFQYKREIKPIHFRDTVLFHPHMSDLDNIRMYLTLGGVPLYHTYAGESYEDYFNRNFFRNGAPMASEALSLLNAEFSPVGRYTRILDAIADGATILKEIQEKSKIDKTTCIRCLEQLVELDIVDIAHPMVGAPKRPLYRISDNLLDFHQRVVRFSEPLWESSEDIYNIMEPRIDTLLGIRFERMCAEFIKENYRLREIGRWWGQDRDGRTHDVDLVARIAEGSNIITVLAECKFRNRKFGTGFLNNLNDSIGFIRSVPDHRRMLFSTSGFTESLEDIAESEGILLVDLDTLYGRKPAPGL